MNSSMSQTRADFSVRRKPRAFDAEAQCQQGSRPRNVNKAFNFYFSDFGLDTRLAWHTTHTLLTSCLSSSSSVRLVPWVALSQTVHSDCLS